MGTCREGARPASDADEDVPRPDLPRSTTVASTSSSRRDDASSHARPRFPTTSSRDLARVEGSRVPRGVVALRAPRGAAGYKGRRVAHAPRVARPRAAPSAQALAPPLPRPRAQTRRGRRLPPRTPRPPRHHEPAPGQGGRGRRRRATRQTPSSPEAPGAPGRRSPRRPRIRHVRTTNAPRRRRASRLRPKQRARLLSHRCGRTRSRGTAADADPGHQSAGAETRRTRRHGHLRRVRIAAIRAREGRTTRKGARSSRSPPPPGDVSREPSACARS